VASLTQVRTIFHSPNFGRLYTTRVVSATADGIFQAALASYVFFSPQNATTPAKAATAFAALLLPYSIAGPFVGVFLDRWRRQRVLVISNTVKVALVVLVAALVLTKSDGAAFFATAVTALGVNRFFLSALSAALPHVVEPVDLIAANALSTTSGSVATIVGAGVLYMLGTGTVKGFAFTLFWGTVVSLVTAVFITRFFVDVLVDNEVLTAPELYGIKRSEIGIFAKSGA